VLDLEVLDLELLDLELLDLEETQCLEAKHQQPKACGVPARAQ
jgi:hypothetical protein